VGNKTRPTRPSRSDDGPNGLSVEALKSSFKNNLYYVLGHFLDTLSLKDKYHALAHSVRDRLLDRWARTGETYGRTRARTVCYLSAEFLLGPHLGNNLINLGVWNEAKKATEELDLDLEKLMAEEEEPGLGNGGLGRLAACYMDSLATLQIPAIGYGIRYEFGIFDQVIRDGWQVEMTDTWLRDGNPWEVRRSKVRFDVKLGGHTEHVVDDEGRHRVRWVPGEVFSGVGYNTPILGYGVGNANLLRLWSAEALESFDLQAFNVGDYYGAVHRKMRCETITKVLYPNDEPEIGKRLRLIQQYFFVTCSLQDMIRVFLQQSSDLADFHRKYVVQLNDTHPSVAVAELMRLLVDEHGMDWDKAWDITTKTFAYTNHTLLAEALEKWPVALFGSVLPRHLEIVYEINRRFLDEVRRRYPNDEERVRRMSLIDEAGGRYVRMAHLACVGSQAVNGVAALHTELLKQTVLRDFYELSPEKFHNVTNGVTPRRWMALSNPKLTALIGSKIGDRWVRNLEGELRRLEPFAGDAPFQQKWRAVKAENKRGLAALIKERTGVVVDPDSLFDVQVKRIHEYKRQHLNVLHVITLYHRLKRRAVKEPVPRTVIFGGKAAPGYVMAKLIIKLITSVAETVNRDPDVSKYLKVVFFPDFNVMNGQVVYPAAELSEQISTAGKEASGTGNMKFSMNGALTIGTLDGANVEIREAVGPENFFLFGLTTEEVDKLKSGGYNPRSYYDADPELREALDSISSGVFSNGDRDLFKPLVDSLLSRDDYLLLADYRAYVDCQERVSRAYRDQKNWTRMSILNVARMGYFSSDRSIREYAEKIWRVKPMAVDVPEPSGSARSSRKKTT
jgi:starch phosphorylase